MADSENESRLPPHALFAIKFARAIAGARPLGPLPSSDERL
jgi:hypothetical protein